MSTANLDLTRLNRPNGRVKDGAKRVGDFQVRIWFGDKFGWRCLP